MRLGDLSAARIIHVRLCPISSSDLPRVPHCVFDRRYAVKNGEDRKVEAQRRSPAPGTINTLALATIPSRDRIARTRRVIAALLLWQQQRGNPSLRGFTHRLREIE
jgi:hypothetical protein